MFFDITFGILFASCILSFAANNISLYFLHSSFDNKLLSSRFSTSSISSIVIYELLYTGIGNIPSIIASHKSYLLTILFENNSFVFGFAISLSYGVFLSLTVYAVIPNILISSCVSIIAFTWAPQIGAPI